MSFWLRSTCASWQGTPRMMEPQSGTSGMTGRCCGTLGVTGFHHRTPGVLGLPRGAESPVWNPRDSRCSIVGSLHRTVPPLPPSPSSFFNSHFQTGQDEEGGGKGDSGAREFIPTHFFPACQMGRRKLSIILYLEVLQWGRATLSQRFQLQGGGQGMGGTPTPCPVLCLRNGVTTRHPPPSPVSQSTPIPCPVSHLPEPDK